MISRAPSGPCIQHGIVASNGKMPQFFDKFRDKRWFLMPEVLYFFHGLRPTTQKCVNFGWCSQPIKCRSSAKLTLPISDQQTPGPAPDCIWTLETIQCETFSSKSFINMPLYQQQGYLCIRQFLNIIAIFQVLLPHPTKLERVSMIILIRVLFIWVGL